MALGFYNTTYYGHAWNLVQYSRSGSDGYYVSPTATAFEKEYYGAFKSKEYFDKAMKASADKNFKARCLFMMARCSQKQINKPQYTQFSNSWDKYNAAEKMYYRQFKNNKYFAALTATYKSTAFFKEASSSCSYLKDFLKRKPVNK